LRTVESREKGNPMGSMLNPELEIPSDLNGRKTVVVGLGRSGLASARLLAREGAEVWVTDRRPAEALSGETASLKDLSVRFALGGHPDSAFSGAALVVVSPGVPAESLPLPGVPVIGEVELACRYLTAPILAITGTNGKSTTTTLTGEILQAAGRRVFVGGNLGRPLTEAVLAGDPLDWVVAEVSSFQLETIRAFRPKVAALLNLTPNHLDRYKGLSDYTRAKLRIFSNQREEDWAVLNHDNPVPGLNRAQLRGRVVSFGRIRRPPKGVWLEGDRLISNLEGLQEVVTRSGILLRGVHNLENAMAAIALGQLAGCPLDVIRGVLRTFGGLEHRLEVIGSRKGIAFVNDSKATTVAATASALSSFHEPVILIAGGQDKGMSFISLKPLLSKKARAVVLIGEARERIRKTLEGDIPIREAESLREAVEAAVGMARPGEVVLLSPGCSSFDMFRDFEDRGRQFKALVGEIA